MCNNFILDTRVMMNDVPTIFNPRKPRLSQSNAVLTSDHRPYGPFSHVLSRSESCKYNVMMFNIIFHNIRFNGCNYLLLDVHSMSARRCRTGRTMPTETVGRVQKAEEQMLFKTCEEGTMAPIRNKLISYSVNGKL